MVCEEINVSITDTETIGVSVEDSETIAISLNESNITGSFLELTDTPNSYSGKENYLVKVNSAGTGLEFNASSAIVNWGGIVGTLSNQTDLQDVLNLKYNSISFNTDWDSRLNIKSTTNLSEGTNLYYTDERVDDRVNDLIQDGIGLTWTYSDIGNTLTGNVSLSSFSTTNLSEGTNLYYTEDRVNANSNVSANTAARHNAVTVNDSTTIDFTLIGQLIEASVIPGAIDHNTLLNTHNLTTSIDHNTITNNHNLTSDIVHQSISGAGTNTHTTIDLHIGNSTAHGITGVVVGTTDGQTLTNKIIDFNDNTASNITIQNFKNTRVYLSTDEQTYLYYNVSTGNIELWKNGGLIVEW